MANKMLIDATHPEETRVVVLRGNRVEEFDFESAQRKQLRGNIYLAKVTRVEPSLQAAFIDYGGNRHGFLAFSEIHPDYYQIPVADRQALIEEEERAQRAADDEVDRRSHRRRHPPRHAARRDQVVRSEATDTADGHADTQGSEQGSEQAADLHHQADEAHHEHAEGEAESHSDFSHAEETPADAGVAEPAQQHQPWEASHNEGESHQAEAHEAEPATEAGDADATHAESAGENGGDIAGAAQGEHGEARHDSEEHARDDGGEEDESAEEVVESVGGADALEEVPDRAPRYRRQYKIQEVIKRRQVMLVQVVKEERGTKGAALTTYLSLAGRYSVLMPNTARGGGISRKITSSEDRARLKEAAQELEVPEGMGVILRTAGASRTKTEIKRDFEYLLRLWETVRDLTLKSTAPKLVYEEGSLVKRSIRDLYNKDIDEVTVAGTEAYQEAKDFMRMLMPSHAKNVKPYADTQPLLSRYGVENQLDAMFSPTVQLRSGGYIVINQTEALVAIDVNSGRATREHHIEDTALKTNLEASDEIARQLRLRDLAGLIVIDFIDMEENRNNRAVERRVKECLKQDRARIQVGRISHFGLLEMSRQRIRTSVLESSTEKCPYCGGSGHVRSVSSLALQVLRALEEQLIKGATHNLIARTRPDVALYVLNLKRAHLRSLEERFAILITVSADESVRAPQAFVIDRGEQIHTVEAARAIAAQQPQSIAAPLEEEDDLEDSSVAKEEEDTEADAGSTATEETGPVEHAEHAEHAEPGEHAEGGHRRRRRRRRGGRNGGEGSPAQHRDHLPAPEPAGDFAAQPDRETAADDDLADQSSESAPADRNERGEPRRDGGRRRRGRRGGRRNRRDRNGEPLNDQAPNENMSHESGQQAPEHAFALAGEPVTSPPAAEPALRQAVADLDAAPLSSRPAAANAEAGRQSTPPAEQEAPRRRSTVRERAPVGGNDAAPPAPTQPASPVPEPVVTEVDAGESADRPRRSGWWSKRFAGG